MQMLPSLRSHQEYVKFADRHIQKVQIPKVHDDVLEKLKLLDLTPFRLLFMPLYSPDFGRPSFAPEDMMRTFIAMTLCGVTSPTDWVDDYLKDESGFYAIASGFLPDEVPSVGCMYDFMSRILKIPKYYKNNYIRPKRKKLTRTQKNA
jgi:hypothetical protein